MMSKKHYEGIAQAIHAARRAVHTGELAQGAELEYVAHALGHMFLRDNPRFDFARFLKACAGED